MGEYSIRTTASDPFFMAQVNNNNNSNNSAVNIAPNDLPHINTIVHR